MDTHYTGNKITELRKAKGWTQKDIAEKLHISVAAVSKWERGLNYPDLSLLEPLAGVLEITVCELLGLENEPTEQIIKNITEISVNEKKESEKRFFKKLCAIAITTVIFIAASCFVYLSVSNNDIMKNLFEISGGTGTLNLLAVLLGLIAWSLAVISIFSRKKEYRWKYYSIFSLISCSISLHIPSLVTYLTMRFEYYSTVEDVIGAYYFGSAVLLLGTILFNICSVIIHRDKSEKQK